METTFNTTYKATGPTKSSIKVTAGELPSELHKMIVWVMHHQEDAAHLLPEYNKIRSRKPSAILQHNAEVSRSSTRLPG